MRILHISTRLILGGSQENTVLSCEGQSRLGHEVHLAYGPIFGPEGSMLARVAAFRTDARGTIGTHEVPDLCRELSPARDRRAKGQLRQLIDRLKPDIVHTHSSKAGILGRAAAWDSPLRRTSGMGTVHTIHGPPFMPIEGSFTRRQKVRATNKIYEWAERYAARRCHLIISVADAMTQQFLARGIGHAEQFRTVYSGMEVERYLELASPAETRTAQRKALNLAEGDFVIGTVSRLAEHKGHDDLLTALAHDLKAHPGWKLLWVGDGWWRDRLLARAKSLGLADQLITTGLVPGDKVPGFMRAMDILVHPSSREGLPRTVPQALLAGVCPVAYDVDGTREACIDGETGRLIPLGDLAGLRRAVRSLYDDPDARQRLAQQGREFCRSRFSAATMVAQLEGVYAQALSLAGSILIVLLLAAAPQALAQRLNLGGPTGPRAGEGKAVLALAAELRSSAPQGNAATERASRSLHTLAAHLLSQGEAAGPAGSARVLVGLKIAHRLPAFDTVMGTADPAVASLIAADLETLAKATPADISAVQVALRDTLAPIVRVAPPPWPQSLMPPPDAAAAAPDVSHYSDPATANASTELRARLAAAKAVPAYAGIAAGLEQELAAAELAISAPPAWLSAPARERLAGDVSLAVRQLAVDAADLAARQSLGRVATVMGLARDTSTLKGNAANRMRTAISRLVIALPAANAPEAKARAQTLASLADAAALLSRRGAMGDEKQFVRQLRPALRMLQQLCESTENDLAEVLPDVLDRADAMSTPKVIGAIAALRRSLDDLVLLRAASDSLVLAGSSSSGDLAARDETKLVADRLLHHAKEASDAARKDDGVSRQKLASALARFRTLAGEVRTALAMPGEPELRAGKLEKVLGKAQPEILASLDASRSEWLKSWSGTERSPSPAVSRRLRGFHAALELAERASSLADMTTDQPKDSANSWGGWELDSAALRTLSLGLPDAVKSITELFIHDEPTADKAFDSTLNKYAVPLLAAQLQKELSARGLATCPNATAAVAELTSGPPPANAWFAAMLPDAAAVSRYGFEASQTFDALKRQALLDFVRSRADELSQAARE